MNNIEYRLHVRIEIEKVSKDYGSTGERLSIAEDLLLPDMKFLEACRILGKFQELAESFKTSK